MIGGLSGLRPLLAQFGSEVLAQVQSAAGTLQGAGQVRGPGELPNYQGFAGRRGPSLGQPVLVGCEAATRRPSLHEAPSDTAHAWLRSKRRRLLLFRLPPLQGGVAALAGLFAAAGPTALSVLMASSGSMPIWYCIACPAGEPPPLTAPPRITPPCLLPSFTKKDACNADAQATAEGVAFSPTILRCWRNPSSVFFFF